MTTGLDPITRTALSSPLFSNEVDSSSYASLSTAVTAIGATVTTLKISTSLFPNGATLTVPATLKLEFVGQGSLTITTGQTVTIVSDGSLWPRRKIFFNALASQGTVSFAGNVALFEFYAAWWGVVGDNSTDCTAILQRITDQLAVDNINFDLILPPGTVVLAGALQDTSLSNAQWVLPKRLSSNQLGIRIRGSGPITSLTGNAGSYGTVLKSTMSSGSGNVIGVKTSSGIGETYLSLWMENLTVQTVVNPTYSVLDLRYCKRVFMDSVKIWQGESGNFTEPTTSTSYALKTPANFVVSDTNFKNLVITGFYNGIECNELADIDAASVGPCVNAFVFPDASHIVSMGRVVAVWPLHTLVFTGVSTVKIEQLDIERSGEVGKWYSTNIDDFSEAAAGNAHGEVGWHLIIPIGVVSVTGFAIAGTAGTAAKNLRLYPIYSSSSRGLIYNYVEPLTGFAAGDHAIFEINRKESTSDETKLGTLLIGAQQTGTTGSLGLIAFVNSSLGAGERRNAQISVGNAGATNSGIMNFSTAIAGAMGSRMTIEKDVMTVKGPLALSEGSAITAANTIAFTHAVHVVN